MRRLSIALVILSALAAGVIAVKTRAIPLSRETLQALPVSDQRSPLPSGALDQLSPPAAAPRGTDLAPKPIGQPSFSAEAPAPFAASSGAPIQRQKSTAHRPVAISGGVNESDPATAAGTAEDPVNRVASFIGSESPPSRTSNEFAAVPSSPVSGPPAVSVPGGAQLPALFHDERPLPAPQRRALDRIANEFIDAVSTNTAGSDGLATWNAARASADQKYITLFGHAAYNALHLQAAKEAVREKRAALASQVGP